MKIHLKKGITILLIFTALAVVFMFVKFKLFDNTITISGNGIDLSKIVIKSIEENKVIYKNNEMVSKIKNQYGGDNFKIFYDGELIGQAGIEKKSWWHTHNYYFNFSKNYSEVIFEFYAKGLEGKTAYYKYYKMDHINNRSIETFYNTEGLTGQITIDYYNEKGEAISDEIWVNDTLVTLNLYINGHLYNYGIHNYLDSTEYSLSKTITTDSIIYLYQTTKDDTTSSERIAIKTSNTL